MQPGSGRKRAKIWGRIGSAIRQAASNKQGKYKGLQHWLRASH